MDLLYTICVAIIVILSIIGTLHKCFSDNIFQTVALALISLGGTGEIFAYLHGIESINPRAFMLMGVALFGLGSAVKVWAYSRKVQPGPVVMVAKGVPDDGYNGVERRRT